MADSYYGGAGAGGGGNEWELVSLTASAYAYAAAPGPVPALPLHDAHSKTEQLTPPPLAAAAIFMSQHFNLPPATTGSCADLNQRKLTPAIPMLDDEADHLDIPYPDESETGQDDGQLTLTSSEDAHKKSASKSNTADADDVLVADAADVALLLPSPSEERQTAADVPAAAAATDAIIATVVGSASPPAAPAVPSGVAGLNKVPSEDHAWWNKTVRFLRNNSRESLTFRFIFVAATGLAVLGQRDQLKLEFNVDTEKISCAVREPLGQVKLNMLVGGRPVAQG